ncbi:hypothetical protein PUR71_22755 [Streptomyces sp. SP17BM10]|uniref:hypothetical protein n=1 Tax=Streptomyces sp. SP17BM10 TaxID=3002530 RepID=UPI002E771EE4|nr:hypothetical protein [Streptomyces sp. SP17BM10]MEE1785700.1 hypothetical protein [Streptomyces sp. SP17BM10]
MTRNAWSVVGWGVAWAGSGTGCALSGTALLGAVWPGWVVAGAGAVAVPTGMAVARGRPGPGLRAVLWGLAGVAAVAAWGLLMDVLALLTGAAVDSGPAAVLHALSAVGTVLLVGAARRRPSAGRRASAAAPSEAPAAVQLAAWAGTVAFVPYVVMKLDWALGGSFAGLDGARIRVADERNGASGLWLALEDWGLDATALMAALGVFLLWGLVRPWGQVFPRWTLVLSGRRVPRWLPLAPALIGAGTLAPYGLMGVGYLSLCTIGVTTIRTGDFPTPDDALLVGWVGMSAFAAYGVALAVAVRSYWRRTGG